MKKLLFIILLLLVLVFGINIGSNSNYNNSEDIKDKIENFENNIIDNSQIKPNNIQPYSINTVANKCNNIVDEIINKVIKSLIK